jgi:hypothetical protein
MIKETKMKKLFEYLLVGILVIPLSGCSMALDQGVKPKVNENQLKSSVAKIVDEQLDVVGPYIEQDTTIKGVIDFDDITGAQVVDGILKEENGHSYLEFAYDIAYNSEDNLEEFVEESKKLLPEKEAQELDDKIEEAKKAIYADYEDLGRAVPPSQQIAFQKDLRKLVTRSVVMFVAGVVYTFLPTTMFWGKISAAAAIAVPCTRPWPPAHLPCPPLPS